MPKILVPVDGSAGSDKALRFALTLAGDQGSQLILINVQPNLHTLHVKRFFSEEQIHAYQDELGRDVFNHALELTKNANCTVTKVLKIGDPATEICAEAEEQEVDFIVMGYRGLGVVQRAIMGSVATQVLHLTTCPLMIVP